MNIAVMGGQTTARHQQMSTMIFVGGMGNIYKYFTRNEFVRYTINIRDMEDRDSKYMRL